MRRCVEKRRLRPCSASCYSTVLEKRKGLVVKVDPLRGACAVRGSVSRKLKTSVRKQMKSMLSDAPTSSRTKDDAN
jgi:hypothetical protein